MVTKKTNLLLTPEQALAMDAQVSDVFQTSSATRPKLSNNGSFSGGYAETLAGLLFTPSGGKPAAAWHAAASFKTSGMTDKDKRECREKSAFVNYRFDIVDLFIPAKALTTGRWFTGLDEQARAAVRDGITTAPKHPGYAYHTCQVKMRNKAEGDLDIIHYSTYLNLDGGALTRQEIVAEKRADGTPVWRADRPDFLVACLFDPFTPQPQITVRIATALDLKLAIVAHCRYEIHDGRSPTKPLKWTGHKVHSTHFFGGEGYTGVEDLDEAALKELRQLGWTQWPIGADVTDVLATVKRPILRFSI